MSFFHNALRAGHARAPTSPSRSSALVVGGAGTLGAAVLERLLAGRGLSRVRVLGCVDIRGDNTAPTC